MVFKLNIANMEQLEALLEEQKELINQLQINASKISSFCSRVEAAINFSNCNAEGQKKSENNGLFSDQEN